VALGKRQPGEQVGLVEQRGKLRLGKGADAHGVFLGADRAGLGFRQYPYGSARLAAQRPAPDLEDLVAIVYS
jgi:hypothetical protein